MKKIIFSILSFYVFVFFFLISWLVLIFSGVEKSEAIQFWFSHTPNTIILLISVPLIISILFIISYLKEKVKLFD